MHRWCVVAGRGGALVGHRLLRRVYNGSGLPVWSLGDLQVITAERARVWERVTPSHHRIAAQCSDSVVVRSKTQNVSDTRSDTTRPMTTDRSPFDHTRTEKREIVSTKLPSYARPVVH